MTRYAALIGSINVGGNQLKMAELKVALEKAGLEKVETVTASGNVLFGADDGNAARSLIERVLKDEFSIDTFAVVRSKAELEAALAENPYDGIGEDKFVYVHFLTDQPSEEAFAKLATDHEGRGQEKMTPGTRALHVDYVDGVGRSTLTGPFIERRLGVKGTARNLRSLRRIIGKFD